MVINQENNLEKFFRIVQEELEGVSEVDIDIRRQSPNISPLRRRNFPNYARHTELLIMTAKISKWDRSDWDYRMYDDRGKTTYRKHHDPPKDYKFITYYVEKFRDEVMENHKELLLPLVFHLMNITSPSFPIQVSGNSSYNTIELTYEAQR